MGASSSQTYKLKATTGKFNTHRSKYTDAQVELIKQKNADILYYFGYTNHPSEENSCAFFDFKEHTKEHLDKYYGFRRDNDKFVKKLSKDGGWMGPKYAVNNDKDCFELFSIENTKKA
jgi:hypothetical protein